MTSAWVAGELAVPSCGERRPVDEQAGAVAPEPARYVLVFVPPWLSFTASGFWALLTTADWDASNFAQARTLNEPEGTPAARLAAWAAGPGGNPVTLEAFTADITVNDGALWHRVPAYRVRRDT